MYCMKAITDRQLEVLQYIDGFIREHRYPPTVRDIQSAFHLASTNGVNDYITALEKKGFIERQPKIARSIRVVRLP